MPQEIDYDAAPNGSGEAFKRYIEDRCPMGSFLNAVLENDLTQACSRADHINKHLIWEYVNWLYNNAPADCWGSIERVQYWLAKREVRS